MNSYVIPLDGQRCSSGRNELLEDLLEVLGHLLEGEQDGFELPLLQDVHQILWNKKIVLIKEPEATGGWR